jgi:hypothetical protein
MQNTSAALFSSKYRNEFVQSEKGRKLKVAFLSKHKEINFLFESDDIVDDFGKMNTVCDVLAMMKGRVASALL